MDATTLSSQCLPFPIKLWPPSNKARQMLVEHIKDNLTSESIFTQKYGSLSKDDAEENAKQIEDVAFSTANQHYENEPDGVGGNAVRLYAKDCSKLLLEALKRWKDDMELTSEKKECSKLLRKDLKRGPGVKDDKELIAEQVTVFDISKDPQAYIQAEEAEDIPRPLKEPNNPCTKICLGNRSFDLGAAPVAGPILVSLKNQLREVDLSGFYAGRGHAEALEGMNLFSLALEGSVLKSLNLSNNALGEKGVRAFGALLKSESCLEELYLRNDGISEEAALAVCKLIPSTKKLEHTGFGWDAETNTVTALKQTWQKFIAAHRDPAQFLVKGCKHCKLLGIIFNKSTATVILHYATQDPPNTEEHNELEEQYLKSSMHLEVDRTTPDGPNIEEGPSQGRKITPLSEKRWKSESGRDQIGEALMAWAETFLRRSEMYERGKSVEATSVVTATGFTIPQCIATLETIEDLDEKIKVKALNLFKDPDNREIFMTSGRMRVAWIESLCETSDS